MISMTLIANHGEMCVQVLCMLLDPEIDFDISRGRVLTLDRNGWTTSYMGGGFLAHAMQAKLLYRTSKQLSSACWARVGSPTVREY